jgi:hypothetical protein
MGTGKSVTFFTVYMLVSIKEICSKRPMLVYCRLIHKKKENSEVRKVLYQVFESTA